MNVPFKTAMKAYSSFLNCGISFTGQGRDAPRSSYHNQRMDHRAPFENQVDGDRRSQPHEEDMDRRYEDNQGGMQTFEGLERKFLDDILKLSKEQADAEDAENARHRERINTISAQYEVQLAALRARHTNRREEFLRSESQARQLQYQQLMMDQYPTTRATPSDLRGYSVDTAPPPSGEEPNRVYNSDYYSSYRGRGRFHGHERDHGYESKTPYPRGRSYDAGSRYH